MFVSIKGSSYARFRRALSTGNPLLIRTAAAELGSLELADALRVTLALLRVEPGSYPRAAAKWVGRLAVETRASLVQVQLAAAALAAMPSHPELACEALGVMAEDLGLPAVAQALDEAGR